MSTPILPLAVWQSGTNENSLPANDNARRLEILNGEVISSAVTAQPGSPAEGDIYILPATHTGSQWAGFDENDLVIYNGGTWTAYAPSAGIVVNLNGTLKQWDGSAYVDAGGGGGGGGTFAPGVQFIAETGSTADSDPGAGLLKWNDSTQASATVLFLDDDSDDGVSLTSLWPNLDPGGLLYLQHATDADTWQLWEVTGVTDATGYAKLNVSLRADGGSFADGDPMVVMFQNGSVAGALTNWTEAVNSSSPNGTVPVVSLTATNAATDVDVALVPKGLGAVTAQVANSSTTGGNKRGASATDWQRVRSNANQVASGIGSTIAGGRNNRASMADATVGGGTGNQASGDQSTVCGGLTNSASATTATVGGGGSNNAGATGATIGGGNANSAGSNYSTIGGGSTNIANGAFSAIGGGANNTSGGDYSWVPGGTRATARGMVGAGAYAAGRFAADGDAQTRVAVLRVSTINNTQTTVTADASAAGASNQLILTNGSAFVVKGFVVARENATGDSAAWEFTAFIKRGANAAATSMVVACTPVSIGADAGAAAWALAVDADTTLGGLRVRVTGETSKTIRWVCDLKSCEVAG